MRTLHKIISGLFVTMCLIIGLYPASYFIFDRHDGLLATKSTEILESYIWNVSFDIHILLGGLALLIGWVQFWQRIRQRYTSLHRKVGMLYLSSVLLSGISGLYIACHATGGLISSLGFLCLAILWLTSTTWGYAAIIKGNYRRHGYLMLISYSACFAAVTLRLWLPLLSSLLGDFISAYRIVAWLCWVPNLMFALLWIRYDQQKRPLKVSASFSAVKDS